jgi:hypothetical protein
MKNIFHDLWGAKETRIGLILSLALILSVFIYSFSTRYRMHCAYTGANNAYLYNRMTGECWFCTANSYRQLEEYKQKQGQ